MKFWQDIKNFKPSEFDSPDNIGSGKKNMSEQFIRKFDMLRNLYRKPIIITSGYRTASYNQQIGGAERSMHLQGKAADILVQGGDAYELLGLAYVVGLKGVGISQKGGNRFIHLDDREQPTIWSY